jgi:uncharacterized membrane protein
LKEFVFGATVYSELIVLILTGEGDSDIVWRTLERDRDGKLLKLIDIVLVRRDNHGKLAFQMSWRESEYLGDDHCRLAGAFAEAIFGVSGEHDRRVLIESGLDPLFLQDVVQAFTAEGAAYLIHVPRESLIDTRAYLEILGTLDGGLYHTTFRPQVEEVLWK